MTSADGTLFFTARDGVHGRELWTSDGTEGGTVLVKDVSPDANGYGYPTRLAAVGGTVFFAADDGVHGRELWRSDGTEAGTVMVEDINLGRGLAALSAKAKNARTVKVRVAVDIPGRLVVRSAGGPWVKRSAQNLDDVGVHTLTLKLTKSTTKKLRRTGKVRIGLRFAFTSCTGAASGATKHYTLRLR